jgi:hypothetical protein
MRERASTSLQWLAWRGIIATKTARAASAAVEYLRRAAVRYTRAETLAIGRSRAVK